MTADPRVVIVATAAALGIHGIHFRSPPALRDELTALGVL